MRREQQPRRSNERGARPERLVFEHIERGAAEAAVPQHRSQGRFVHDPAARRVDQDCVALHQRKAVAADQPARGVGERQVQRHDVAAPQELVEGEGGGPRLGPRMVTVGHLRIVPHHPHADRCRLARREPPDAAETDDADHLPGRLAALREHLPRPGSRFDRARREIGAAQQHQGRGHDVLGDRLGIRAGGRDHLDAARGAFDNVNVVETDAESPDHAHARGRVQQRPAHRRAIANDPRIRPGQRGLERRQVVDQLGPIVHVESRLQPLDRGRVHELADHDAIGHACECSGGPTRRAR